MICPRSKILINLTEAKILCSKSNCLIKISKHLMQSMPYMFDKYGIGIYTLGIV